MVLFKIWSLTLHFLGRQEKFNAQKYFCNVSERFVHLFKLAEDTLNASPQCVQFLSH